jgi:DNA polymerase III epsilon subunit-like protein
VFKAAQLVRSRGFTNAFRDFTAIDVETTDRDVATAELVEMAAVRVRDGVIVDEFHSLVKPRVGIAQGATRTHGITMDAVSDAPYFEEVWPRFHEFCGRDMLVAHNGYQFDFPILQRMAGVSLCTYDTLPLARDLHPGSAKLPDLARHFGIDPGASHRALDDTRTLARVFLALGEAKVVRARKTALPNLLDSLAVALALSEDGELDEEALLLQRLARPFALGRYSDCLEHYRVERELAADNTIPTVAELIERLGGENNMERIRATKNADDRYPMAMARLRRLLDKCGGADCSMSQQLSRFFEYVALSKSDGAEPERERVNLLTLHSTKGLEFSRVYIVGVEDAQLPGGTAAKPPTVTELEEARRLLYVGMTRAKDRLVLTHVAERGGKLTGGHRFLDEMGLAPTTPTTTITPRMS